MKNLSEWKPTKIQRRGNEFCVNPNGLAPGSLYITMEAFRVLNSKKSYLHGHLLDLGCGNVPYYEWYKAQVSQITCVDWPASLHSGKHIDIFADLNQPLPLANSSMDCVLSTSVLEHIREPQLLLKEIRRILTRDGYLILSVPFLYHLHEEPFDFYRYTPHGLKHLALEAELDLVTVEHYGSAFGVVIDVTSKISESLLTAICKLLPKYISEAMMWTGKQILHKFQQICFFIFKQQLILSLVERLNLSRRIALGYVAVFKAIDKKMAN